MAWRKESVEEVDEVVSGWSSPRRRGTLLRLRISGFLVGDVGGQDDR